MQEYIHEEKFEDSNFNMRKCAEEILVKSHTRTTLDEELFMFISNYMQPIYSEVSSY